MGLCLTCVQVLANLGTAEIDQNLEERLIDGIIYAYQEQVLCPPLSCVLVSPTQISDDTVVLNGCGNIINCLGLRSKPYLRQVDLS